MDSRIVNEKAEAYQGRVLRLNPSLIDELGLIKRGIHLKIDEFYVSCFPFDLSLGKASLLASLSQKEIDFFRNLAKRPHKLNLNFKVPSASKPITFFVLSDIVDFRKPNAESPYCFIDVKFKETPFALKEILVTWFVQTDEGEAFFADPTDLPVPLERLGDFFAHPHLALLREGAVADRLRILAMSKRGIRVFGEYSGPPPEKGETLDFEAPAEEGAVPIRGSCTEFTTSAELPGFAWIGIDLVYNSYLVGRLMRLFVQGRNSPST